MAFIKLCFCGTDPCSCLALEGERTFNHFRITGETVYPAIVEYIEQAAFYEDIAHDHTYSCILVEFPVDFDDYEDTAHVELESTENAEIAMNDLPYDNCEE
ncbi:hypothetical protein [Candidatus Ichthyocystis hellenicum]|uniref:hypothetical protein n=1 Tax=Candidatus Ichthyocystis hellenicum TaxID=1561003 RepID=UPI000B83EFF7|nr:hypothetical protein [Candidatus Ichthyocystis hellenicum]